MAAKMCKKCGAPLPLQFGPGRRRVMCESCAPTRDRGRSGKPREPKPRVDVPTVTVGLVQVTKRDLEAAEATDTPIGQAALLLADRIEFGEDRGAGLASLVKQFRECMAQIEASKPEQVSDPLDELRKRRESRGA